MPHQCPGHEKCALPYLSQDGHMQFFKRQGLPIDEHPDEFEKYGMDIQWSRMYGCVRCGREFKTQRETKDHVERRCHYARRDLRSIQAAAILSAEDSPKASVKLGRYL
jgi:hypothetical protein